MEREIEQQVGAILNKLSSYKNDVVVIGGICAAIYHREQQEAIGTQLFTTDLDLACEEERVVARGAKISSVLEDAGFDEVLEKAGEQVVSKYTKQQGGTLFEVEFLLPARGSDPDQVGYVQPDLTAEKVRYLDLLLVEPDLVEWNFGETSVEFRRPKPGLFILQKALSVGQRRDQEKRRKDYAYILTVIELFSDEMDRLVEQAVQASKKTKEYAAWIEQARRKIETYFLGSQEAIDYAVELSPGIGPRRARALIEEFLRASSS